MGKNRIYLTLIFVMTLACPGCATMRNAPPVGFEEDTSVMGVSGLYVFADEPNQKFMKDMVISMDQESPEEFPRSEDGSRTYAALAISGGAEDGAYGAGILKGWDDSGSQPPFKVVTGISTGAIMAPFAFLGKGHYNVLEDIYTTMSTKNVMKSYSILHLLYGNSFASNKPLERIINRIITPQVIKEIAVEHSTGRRLYIGTTNLDAQRLMLWDMGKVAGIGGEKARKLFCRVIIASAAIPGMFPPSIFKVKLDGKNYDEMHVDGGVVTQVCFLNIVLKGFRAALREDGIDPEKMEIRLYIIRNGRVYPEWEQVPDTLHGITTRAFDTMIDAQGVGDLYKLYVFSKEQDLDYNVTFIPASFTYKPKQLFDRRYMKKLFDFGYTQAMEGDIWSKEPPGLEIAAQ